MKTDSNPISLSIQTPLIWPNHTSLAMLCTFIVHGREAAQMSLPRSVVAESISKRIHFRTRRLWFTLPMEAQFHLNVILSRLRTQLKLDLHSKILWRLSQRFYFQTYFKIVREGMKCTGRTSMQLLSFRTHSSIVQQVKRAVPFMQDKSQTLWFKKMFSIAIVPLCKCMTMQKTCHTKDSL